MRVAEILRKALGGHTMAEVGVATAIGVRAPDVAWCSDSYLAVHPEEMPLFSAPEICVEIVSVSNALPKLREKALAYLNAGAIEAWLVFPATGQLEFYDLDGRREKTEHESDGRLPAQTRIDAGALTHSARKRPNCSVSRAM